MAKRCPSCGHINSDDRFICSVCDEFLDPKAKLMMDLDKMEKHPEQFRTRSFDEPVDTKDDDDYVVPTRKVEEKKSHSGLIIGLLVVVAVAAWFFLK